MAFSLGYQALPAKAGSYVFLSRPRLASKFAYVRHPILISLWQSQAPEQHIDYAIDQSLSSFIVAVLKVAVRHTSELTLADSSSSSRLRT